MLTRPDPMVLMECSCSSDGVLAKFGGEYTRGKWIQVVKEFTFVHLYHNLGIYHNPGISMIVNNIFASILQ